MRPAEMESPEDLNIGMTVEGAPNRMRRVDVYNVNPPIADVMSSTGELFGVFPSFSFLVDEAHVSDVTGVEIRGIRPRCVLKNGFFDSCRV